MDRDLEESVYSVLRGRRDSSHGYSSISDFQANLSQAPLHEARGRQGWVLWNPNHTTHHLHKTITDILKHISAQIWLDIFLIQFWALVHVDGRHHCLSASHHPFYISHTLRGHCLYRNLCVDHVYRVDVEDEEEERPIGGVGRAYRNKRLESTPDLRLYSMDEFPLRDEAARCRFRGYLALHLFDLHHQSQCCGVLELLSYSPTTKNKMPTLDRGLQMAGLRSTHIDFRPTEMPQKQMQEPESEIKAILESCIKLVPRLSLAQVWIPCKQCADTRTTFFCMERTSFITARASTVNSCQNIDENTYEYLQCCEFQSLQVVLHRGSLNGVSILKDPLAHYAMRARLSHCFAVRVESVSNSNEAYVLQFLLQSKDACSDSSEQLLLRIIETRLKRFKLLAREQFTVEFDDQSRKFEGIDMLDAMDSHLSELNFTEYMETFELCFLRPSTEIISNKGWVFRSPDKDKLPENDGKMVHFMKEVANNFCQGSWMVQFWAPKMMGDMCCLETSAQPYALGCLAKGLATFRKKCVKHHYFVHEEVKEEELGPPGRVFRNGHPEFTPNLLLYSSKEFPMRNCAVDCCPRQYFVVPVFRGNNHKCVGVLELLGFSYLDLKNFGRLLEVAELYSTHIDFHPIYLGNGVANSIRCKREIALCEMLSALGVITKIPQLHAANVWVPRRECIGTNSNLSCMELAISTNDIYKLMPTDEVHWIHIRPRKGIVGMVLASENKSCFCPNIREFSIADHPLSHYEIIEKGDICFAICLQSSHTGNLIYVLQFFLFEGSATCENLHSFFNFLMPVMEKELATFKVANGKELGQELVVDVIEFSEASTAISYDCKLDQTGVFPVKFKSVMYGQHIEEQHVQSNHPRQAKQCSFVKKTMKGKWKTRLQLTSEILMPHFGKKLENVEKELGVGRSTIKRACRKNGIDWWPCNEKQARNQSLFEAESSQNLSSSNNTKDLYTSLQQNVTRTNMENVMVKVKYGEDIIKFELCLSLGVNKLFQEVARRLKLKMSSFKLKYMDEDDDEILIACDDDLQLYAKSSTAMDKGCIQLFVPKHV